MKFLLKTAVSAAAGLIFSLGFAPDPALPRAIFTLSGFFVFSLLLSGENSARQAALSGFLFGLASFVPGLSWVFQSLHVYGGLPVPLAASAELLLAAANAAFFSAAAFLCCRLLSPSPLRSGLLFPAVFLLCSWLRGAGLASFPWLSAGYGLENTFFEGFAPLAGVYGTEFAALLAVAAITVSVSEKSLRPRLAGLFSAAAIAAAGASLQSIVWSEPGTALSVRIVQPDLPLAGVASVPSLPLRERISRALELSSGNLKEGTVIIWPESVISTSLQRVSVQNQDLLRSAAAPGNAFIFNAFWEPAPGDFSNSLFLLQDGAVSRYDKRHLVPFGEYVPGGFRWLTDALGIPMSNQQPGASDQKPFLIRETAVAPLICYENAFGSELAAFWHQDSRKNPELILVASNLAWFSESIFTQHLLFSRMRALETARPLVSANNNGASAVISADGRILEQLPPGPALLDADVQTADGHPTPFIRFGNIPAVLLALAAAAFCMLFRKTEI